MNDIVDIKVIRREEIMPGDYILVSCKKEGADLGEIANWADLYFKGSRGRVGIITDDIEIRIMGKEGKDGVSKPLEAPQRDA